MLLKPKKKKKLLRIKCGASKGLVFFFFGGGGGGGGGGGREGGFHILKIPVSFYELIFLKSVVGQDLFLKLNLPCQN